VAGPRLWNQLEVHLRESRNVESFKAGLKTHLFKQAFMCLSTDLILIYVGFF
jgi:hypothetical protein